MTPTRPLQLVAAGGVAAVLGFTAADLFDKLAVRNLPVPWSSVLTVAALAVALAGWAWSFRRRLGDGRSPVDPFVAVRTAALAMAASRSGAVIAGLYAGIGGWYASDLSTPAARDRALTCVAGVVAAIALLVVALWLEKICRLPGDDDESDESSLPAGDPDGDWVHPRNSRNH